MSEHVARADTEVIMKRGVQVLKVASYLVDKFKADLRVGGADCQVQLIAPGTPGPNTRSRRGQQNAQKKAKTHVLNLSKRLVARFPFLAHNAPVGETEPVVTLQARRERATRDEHSFSGDVERRRVPHRVLGTLPAIPAREGFSSNSCRCGVSLGTVTIIVLPKSVATSLK